LSNLEPQVDNIDKHVLPQRRKTNSWHQADNFIQILIGWHPKVT